jgi:pyruvoyl-dependent arginine decarboxylase (PvlArgDC)
MVDTNVLKSIFGSNCIVLENEVRIIVPSTKSVNQSVSNSAMVDYVAAELSAVNGGATITSGNGCWNSDEFGLIKEGVSVVSSNCAEITAELLTKVYQIGHKILVEMSQEAVSVVVNGTLILITE